MCVVYIWQCVYTFLCETTAFSLEEQNKKSCVVTEVDELLKLVNFRRVLPSSLLLEAFFICLLPSQSNIALAS